MAASGWSEILNKYYGEIAVKVDRLFAVLLIFEFFAALFFAYFFTESTWIGQSPHKSLHITVSLIFAGLSTAIPCYRIWRWPGDYANRYIATTAQIIYSILFIHLTGGHLESHFHIFGSLGFLYAYRDFRPLILAFVISAIDHLFRGFYFPMSIFGAPAADLVKALEHIGWAAFANVILFFAIKGSRNEMRTIAQQQMRLQETMASIEEQVAIRTEELQASRNTILEQQESLINVSKMSALGEMAGGIAHEINTPLGVIQMRSDQLLDACREGDLKNEDLLMGLISIGQTVTRISKVINGLRTFAREGRQDSLELYSTFTLVEETFNLCRERFNSYGVALEFISVGEAYIYCRPTQIAQVLLNLLNNSFDAVQNLEEKWVRVEVAEGPQYITLTVIDSGLGIPSEIQSKVLQPFFTTKEPGKGTGLGLSISQGLVESHGGHLYIDNSRPNTSIAFQLPKAVPERSEQAV